MSERYYVEQPLAEGVVTLAGPEAHHLARVCRVRAGDRVYLFNGDGRQYRAAVVGAGRRDVTLEVEAAEEPRRELDFRLEVAAPLPKGDRAQFLVEKLTELGVTEFVPLRTARGVIPAGGARREKLRRYVIEASKQCGRNVLMGVAEPAGWAEYVRRPGLPACRVVAHPPPQGEVGGLTRPAGAAVAAAVGPEGGFTDEEVALAREAGWGVLSLGPRVLRVETAALLLAAWALR